MLKLNSHHNATLRPTAAALLVLLGSVACGSSEAKIDLPNAPSATSERSVAVELTRVEPRSIAVPVRATGTTQPSRAADLAPRITSRIQAVLVQEGDEVKKGTPLVRLDANEARLFSAEAAARAASTEAQAKQVASDLARLTPLAARGSIPQQRIDQLASQKEALEAAARAAEAAAKQAAQDVAESTLRAPFDGRVSSIHVEAGEVAVTTPPTTLLRLVDLSEIEVRIPVHERDLSRIAVGDEARVRIPSNGREITAKVSYIRPEIDPRTRTAEVVVRFDNRERPLLAGMFAEVTIEPTTQRTALVVLSSAVGRAGDERFVYVVEQGRARRAPVEVQDLDERRLEVLSGLEPRAHVVARGLDRLSDGIAVTDASTKEAEVAPTSTQGAQDPEHVADQRAEP